MVYETYFENKALVVRVDGENFAEDGLQALRLALALRNVFLQIIQVGIDLNLDEIRRLDDFAELRRNFGVLEWRP